MVLGNYLVLGEGYTDEYGGLATMLLPLLISAVGIIFSYIGGLFVRAKDDSKESGVQASLNLGNWISIGLTAIASFFLIKMILPETMMMAFFGEENARQIGNVDVFWSVLIGLGVGGALG